jgi:hypothetical protein
MTAVRQLTTEPKVHMKTSDYWTSTKWGIKNNFFINCFKTIKIYQKLLEKFLVLNEKIKFQKFMISRFTSFSRVMYL